MVSARVYDYNHSFTFFANFLAGRDACLALWRSSPSRTSRPHARSITSGSPTRPADRSPGTAPRTAAPGSAGEFRLRSDTRTTARPKVIPVVRPRPSTGNRIGCRKRDRVQALVDVAATYLETLPGEPADDHTVVMVHVNAEGLGVPAGTPRVTPNTFPRERPSSRAPAASRAAAQSSLRPPNACCVRRVCRACLWVAEARCASWGVRSVSRPGRDAWR